jgi:Holliday junction resolvasome RuvABC DNA-binding subunit
VRGISKKNKALKLNSMVQLKDPTQRMRNPSNKKIYRLGYKNRAIKKAAQDVNSENGTESESSENFNRTVVPEL